ncbi:hypothetical protein ACEWY4_024517 [Coilia grayii]|uniref:C3H1-type domain-containing protein n=1 Tax=Coilia grayii TaxID=363190 RepID=A0ABD1J1I8_9TELE
MNSNRASLGSKPEMTSDREESRVQLDSQLFLKLGFSTAQVQAVRQKLGLNADTNTVLGELVLAGVEQGQICSTLLPHGESPHKNYAPAACTPTQVFVDGDFLKPIVIDGSNVAMSHGNKEVFSCLGIQLAVNFFLDRGHTDTTVFVPKWRREQPRPDVPITDQHILLELEKRKLLVFTPSRRVAGKRVVCYDDRFIVKLAYDSDGVIVSNDTYRDLQGENPEWKRFIEDRLLMYSFVNDRFMVPDDPLGRNGPTLENFLRKTPRAVKRPPCPYGKKCTYGIKCKFSHPERSKQSNCALADELREKAKQSASQTSSKPRRAPGTAGSSHSLSLEEIVESKLHLEPAGPPRKAQACENMLVLKGGPLASRRQHSKRDRLSHSQNPNLHTNAVYSAGVNSFPSGSQECLDSGLGSYEANPECHKSGDTKKSRSLQARRQHYSPPPIKGSQSFPCCPLSPPMPTQPSQQCTHHSTGSQDADLSSFSQPCYPPYGNPLHPASLPHYSIATYSSLSPGHSYPPPQHGPWSAPYTSRFAQSSHEVPSGEPVQCHTWCPPAACSNPPSSGSRQEVRKKLMAIFSAHLVDRAMGRFPQVIDPQRLAAEILTLQSQEGIFGVGNVDSGKAPPYD